MKRLEQLSQSTQDELNRLHRREITAWGTGQVEVATTCRLRWVALYLEAKGCSSPQPRLIVTTSGVTQARRRATVKGWKEEKDARPLIAVKQSREVLYSDAQGVPHCYYVLTLACGHDVIDYAVDPNTPAPKRRRCKECGAAILEARHSQESKATLTATAEGLECLSFDKSRLG